MRDGELGTEPGIEKLGIGAGLEIIGAHVAWETG